MWEEIPKPLKHQLAAIDITILGFRTTTIFRWLRSRVAILLLVASVRFSPGHMDLCLK